MGILGELLREMKIMKKTQATAKKYLAMTADEMKALSDEELDEAVYSVFYFNDDPSDIPHRNTAQITVITVGYFDAEVNNGGLCQFFVNSSRAYAPYVADSLERIGAGEIKDIFLDFVRTHKIDLNDLSSFEIDSVAEYGTQTERYPFDEFDYKYYEFDNVHDLMNKYIRDNIETIFLK